jgi:hypothetical protein
VNEHPLQPAPAGFLFALKINVVMIFRIGAMIGVVRRQNRRYPYNWCSQYDHT